APSTGATGIAGVEPRGSWTSILWRAQKNLLHFPQPRTILVVIAESSYRSNLVGAVRFVFRKFVVTIAEPRRVLVVRAEQLVHGTVVTWEAARVHVDEIIACSRSSNTLSMRRSVR